MSNTLPPETPEIIYHYTTTAGLIGIVDSRTLWATDIEFMNDAQEGRYGRGEVRAALLERAKEIESGPDGGPGGAERSRATIIRSAADHLDPGGLYATQQYFYNFACCFCEEKDLLSQWRGYGGAGGYSIGFRTSSLSDSRLAHAPDDYDRTELRLVQVRYGPAARAEMIARVVADVAPRPAGHPGTAGYSQAGTIVLPALCAVKHEAFAEEREWRLLAVTDQHRPEFRSGSMGPTPYLEVRFPNVAITEIVIGPGANSDVRQLGVRRLLSAGGYDDVRVTGSRAPYRT